jgi:hypothetical protein
VVLQLRQRGQADRSDRGDQRFERCVVVYSRGGSFHTGFLDLRRHSFVLVGVLQASRLSNECESLRNTGQEVRTRPFVHQATPRNDLDSILLYTASLKLKAKLFCIPITGKYLCLVFMFGALCMLVLGQCHYFNDN